MLKHIEITTNIGCFNRCDYCPQDLIVIEYSKRSNIMQMSRETFIACIKRINKEIRIGFTGFSEPFLNKNCLWMIGLSKMFGHAVHISTTLVGLDIEHIEELAEIDFDIFDVHLPGETEDSIPKTDEHIEKLKKLSKLKIPNIQYHYHGEAPYRKLDFMAARPIISHSRAGNISYLKEKESSFYSPVTCQREFSCPVLLPNGDLVLCCMDYGLKHVLGNLLTQKLEEIYNGKPFEELILSTKSMTGSICHRCSAFGIKEEL